jgi:hypothetical protein
MEVPAPWIKKLNSIKARLVKLIQSRRGPPRQLSSFGFGSRNLWRWSRWDPIQQRNEFTLTASIRFAVNCLQMGPDGCDCNSKL